MYAHVWTYITILHVFSVRHTYPKAYIQNIRVDVEMDGGWE